MLQQYKNKDKFIIGPNTANRFTAAVDSLLTKRIDLVAFKESFVELHVYSGDTWISGNHTTPVINPDRYKLKFETYNNQHEFNGIPVAIDIFKEFNQLKLVNGNFRFAVNFFKNLIGSYQEQYLYVDEISPDRTELRLKLITGVNSVGKNQFIEYTNLNKKSPQTHRKTYTQYLLNFSRNKTVAYVNSVVVGDFLYIKLLDRLPDDIDVKFKCWVVEEIRPTHIDYITLYDSSKKSTGRKLKNANWDVQVDGLNSSFESGIKNWNTLLGDSTSVSQQIIDNYFSGSLSGVPLNIDYRDFNNFIFYSSATQRLRNFKYKLESIEYYNSQINFLQTVSGSNAIANIEDYQKTLTGIVGSFDSFEKYLYYESSSLLTTNDIPVINPTVYNLTGSYVFPVPKTNSTKPYINYATTSSNFISWYDTLIESASLYDTLNLNRLINSLPEVTRMVDTEGQFELFVDMLGHHYDIIYSYVKQSAEIYKREENPKLGVPNELLLHVAKQFGWNLQDGNQYQELWQYTLGTDETGTPLTGSNTVGEPSVAGREMTQHTWRRIVNNLPYILKSKGTKRSIQALLACYGIPESMISINEYGGPRVERIPVYEKLNFDYSLDLINNSAGTVTINYNQPIGAFEMRFRTDNVETNPTMPNIMNLATIGSNVITLNFTSGNKGTVNINGTASAPIELFDGNWLNLVLQQNGSNLDLLVKKSKYGKIIATVSASNASTFSSTGTITLGGTTSGSRLKGQLQELRLWTGSLSVSAFENHTKAPSAYDADTSTYDELVFRLPLTQKINHNLTGSLNGVEPFASNISASFVGWTNAEPYDSIEEMYYFDGISLAAGTNDDNKVRIEANDLLDNTLYVDKRAEVSEYDQAPLDSHRLGVYFSPQTMINDDIIAHLGYTELDSYIGDPGDVEDNDYPLLKRVAQNYWRKYVDKNDMNSFIRIFTMFDLSFFQQLQQILPARAEKLTGILIQPNLLERNKQHILPTVTREYQDLYFELSSITNSIYAETSYLSASISIDSNSTATGSFEIEYTGSLSIDIISNNDNPIISAISGGIGSYVDVLAEAADSLVFYLTGSTDSRYESFKYSYDYLYKSGSTYITGSSPYWKNEPILYAITSSVVSEFLTKIETFISGGIKYETTSSSTVTDFKPAGLSNLFYNGCKMTSPGFNVPSPDTYQGKPVVEIIDVNPNQIIFNNTNTTNLTGT